jgi:hypothetical protein
MSKISTNITIDTKVKEMVDELRIKPTENRTFSNMIETLVKEALHARAIKIKHKKK